jgi:hypothetical protein
MYVCASYMYNTVRIGLHMDIRLFDQKASHSTENLDPRFAMYVFVLYMYVRASSHMVARDLNLTRRRHNRRLIHTYTYIHIHMHIRT